MFVDLKGRLKTYAMVDPVKKLVLATCSYVGQDSDRVMQNLKKAGHENLVLHNLTHPKCPDWLREMMRADPDYCRGRMDQYDARARTLRSRAAALVTEAEEEEARAAQWRELVEAASKPKDPSPGM